MKKADEHLRIVRQQSKASTYLKELIYGGVDGTITTFAVVAGFSGAALSNEATTQLSFTMVLLFGLANLFADGASMGLGNFLAVRSEKSLYCSIRAKEEKESVDHEDLESEETKAILMERGFSEVDAKTLTTIYKKNDPYWVDFLMMNELKIPDPTDENPLFTGLATFCAFLAFGFIPLVPFVLMGSFEESTAFEYSALGAGVSLVLLGVCKWKIVGTSLVKSVGEIVIVGSAAASIAFLVGSFFTI